MALSAYTASPTMPSVAAAVLPQQAALTYYPSLPTVKPLYPKATTYAMASSQTPGKANLLSAMPASKPSWNKGMLAASLELGSWTSRDWSVDQAADTFINATVDNAFGVDNKQVNEVFKQVYQHHAHKAFDQAVASKAKESAYQVNNALELLDRQWSGPFRPFMAIPRKEAVDYWQHGKNLYRGTASEYRLRGMWTAVTDFLEVCKQHPIISGGVIGAVAYYGGKYPFLGGVSGVGIMAWSGAVVALNELKAKRLPQSKQQEKAECYTQSGENITAFLLTASGADGIYAGTKNGLKVMAETSPKLQQLPKAQQWAARGWKAIGSQLDHSEAVGLRFVVGLFDNVLLPFNALADKLQGKQARPGAQANQP